MHRVLLLKEKWELCFQLENANQTKIPQICILKNVLQIFANISISFFFLTIDNKDINN